MNISSAISRTKEYYRLHGMVAMLKRAGIQGKRALFNSRMVVFYCQLDERRLSPAIASRTMTVTRVRTLAELSATHFKIMTSFWNPKLANRNIRERFEKGAMLWLIECEQQLAGYGWTLQGSTIEPYYFPLTQNDVHLFDFHVFPAYRGLGVNPYLVGQILDRLATCCSGRAFIEAAEWNVAQLSSLRKTPFRRLGSVRSLTLRGRTFVSWMKSGVVAQVHGGAEPADSILRTTRSNEK
jgi:hypothetical protein